MTLEQLKSFRFFPKFLSGQSLRKDEYRRPWKIFVIKIVMRLSLLSGPRLTAVGLLTVGLLGVAEWAIGLSLHFSMLHLIPIMLVTWFGGIGRGVMTSAASTMTGLLVHLLSRAFYPSSLSLYQYVSVRLGVFLAVLFILSVMKKSLDDEKEMPGPMF